MSGRIPVGSAVLMTAIVTSIGYGIMYLTTPTDQQFYDRLAPDLKRKVDENRAASAAANARAEQLAEINRSSEKGKPVWSGGA